MIHKFDRPWNLFGEQGSYRERPRPRTPPTCVGPVGNSRVSVSTLVLYSGSKFHYLCQCIDHYLQNIDWRSPSTLQMFSFTQSWDRRSTDLQIYVLICTVIDRVWSYWTFKSCVWSGEPGRHIIHLIVQGHALARTLLLIYQLYPSTIKQISFSLFDNEK